MTHALELQGVACARSGHTLFSRLNHAVPMGHLLRVKGANGAGKTSLLRMICGLLTASEGQILWRGRNVIDLREDLGGDLVYVGHAAAVKEDLSPIENLMAACTLGGYEVSESEARRALDEAGLKSHWRTPTRRLSQGQRRRSVFARLALPPTSSRWATLWVLDEPFNALDADATDWLCVLIRRQLLRGGVVVLTSHQDVALEGAAQQALEL